MRLQALLLDFGGTLAREFPSRAAIYAAAAAARGCEVREDAMAAAMARAHASLPAEIDGEWRYSDPWFRAFIQRIFHGELGMERAALGDLAEELFARFSDAATFRVFPGALELLESARSRGLSVAVVSNWSPRLALLMGRLGLAEHFDAIVASAEERLEKPDPALFHRALERIGVPPAAALHAGDRVDADVRGARAAGVSPVLVDHSGRMGAEDETGGAPVVGSLPALDAHVAQLVPTR